MEHGRIERLTIESAALQGNALGDPHVRELPVYLPPGYDADAARRYPVLWNLTGFTGFGAMQLNLSGWGEAIHQRLDRLIGAGCPPVIMALPDCFTRLGGSQYLDSSATGAYETHLITELVPALDQTFRTLAEPAHRGVLGKSSGGYGALVQAMRHPEVFGACACHSGDLAFEHCYLPDFAAVVRANAAAGSLTQWLAGFDAAPKKTAAHHQVINVLGMASCYSPNPDLAPPLAFDLPFDLATGAINAAVWARWLAWDPVRMVDQPAYADALRGLRRLFVDCGTKDEFRLDIGARIFAARLAALDIAHEHVEFDDGHMAITYRYDVSVPKLAAALSA